MLKSLKEDEVKNLMRKQLNRNGLDVYDWMLDKVYQITQTQKNS